MQNHDVIKTGKNPRNSRLTWHTGRAIGRTRCAARFNNSTRLRVVFGIQVCRLLIAAAPRWPTSILRIVSIKSYTEKPKKKKKKKETVRNSTIQPRWNRATCTRTDCTLGDRRITLIVLPADKNYLYSYFSFFFYPLFSRFYKFYSCNL